MALKRLVESLQEAKGEASLPQLSTRAVVGRGKRMMRAIDCPVVKQILPLVTQDMSVCHIFVAIRLDDGIYTVG